jgi:prepilin-type N-terminal cleavage/methylation domain-containing protein/prepilin-type processing-associated H-X9-DG protein
MSIRRKRPAFTLVELLVVIAIIGLLIAILVPAVQAASEAARRTDCSSKLKQISLALLNRHDVYKKFPPAHSHNQAGFPDYGQPAHEDNWTDISWMARILPYIEQQQLYDHIQPGEYAYRHPEAGLPGGGYINGVELELLRCPSDAAPGKHALHVFDGEPDVEYAHTSYLGFNGRNQFTYDGMLYINSQVRLADVTDGTSQTLLVGERPATSYDGWVGWWFAGSGHYPWFGAIDVVLGSNEKIAVGGESKPNDPLYPESFYQPPTSPLSDEENAYHFWSFHPGGAYFALVDGHVKFIPYTVDQKVLPSLATRHGSEVVDGQSY